MNTAKVYSIIEKEGVGRCVVAARDIKAGEIILEDAAAAAGPKEQQVNE